MYNNIDVVVCRYGFPRIIITENGVSDPGDPNVPMKEAIEDDFRINYYSGYMLL